MNSRSVPELLDFFRVGVQWSAKAFVAMLKPDSTTPMNQVDFVFISADENKAEETRDGRAFDRLLDTLAVKLEGLGFSHIHLARPPALVVESSTWSNARRINRAFIFRIIADSLFGIFQSNKFRFRTKLYSNLFEALRPKAVFAIGSRGYMWQAAKNLGIPFVEVLHATGYENLATTPTFSRGSTEGYPGFVISFDEVSSTSWLRLVGDENRLLRLENFWLREFLEASSAPELPLLHLPRSRPWENFDRRVLLTLTSSILGANPLFSERDALRGYPEEILRTIERTKESVFWMVRMHPVMAKARDPRRRAQRGRIWAALKNLENVDVVESSRSPLPVLLKDVTHHITSDSTATYEAAEFGIPSLLISSQLPGIGRHHLSSLVGEGYAALAGNAGTTVIDWILTANPLKPRGALTSGMTVEELVQRLTKSSL